MKTEVSVWVFLCQRDNRSQDEPFPEQLSPVSQAIVRLVTALTSGCSGSSDGRGGCRSGAQEHV